MILPIMALGNQVLKLKAKEIKNDHKNLDKLIQDMWETMYNANGVGLAAPQIGKSIRLFIVDTAPFANDEELDSSERKKSLILEGFYKLIILSKSSNLCSFTEGCLSVPDIEKMLNVKIK